MMKKTFGFPVGYATLSKEFKPTDKTQLQIASVKLFNPRRQKWLRHFTWTEDGTYIVGLTACGRASVTALQLNNAYAVTVRQAWVSAGWHPPEEI